jgi:transposase
MPVAVPGSRPTSASGWQDLEREVKELRRANEILKAASAFFARELDPRPPR